MVRYGQGRLGALEDRLGALEEHVARIGRENLQVALVAWVWWRGMLPGRARGGAGAAVCWQGPGVRAAPPMGREWMVPGVAAECLLLLPRLPASRRPPAIVRRPVLACCAGAEPPGGAHQVRAGGCAALPCFAVVLQALPLTTPAGMAWVGPGVRHSPGALSPALLCACPCCQQVLWSQRRRRAGSRHSGGRGGDPRRPGGGAAGLLARQPLADLCVHWWAGEGGGHGRLADRVVLCMY